MTAAVSGAKTRHRDQPIHPRDLHGIDQDACRSREKRRRFDDGSKGDVDTERLDSHVDAFECIPNRATFERVARKLLQVRILDRYACRRTRQSTDFMTAAKGSLHRFKSDATAGANDENFGHALSYLVSAQWGQVGHVLGVGLRGASPRTLYELVEAGGSSSSASSCSMAA